MHEMSLVRSLLTQVKQIMIQHEASSVDLVTVEIGPLSGVEAELVQDAFSQLLPMHSLGAPKLQINEIGLQIKCHDCQRESSLEELTLQCPLCQSAQIQILRGDAFRLMDVSLQVPNISKGVEV